jgi:RIP homotypic interaction motif (RHIM)-containing protein
MDPVTLIVTALAAGSSAGAISALQDDVKATVKAAYAYLRGLARKRVAGQPGAELVLAEHEADPETWAAPLAKKLTEAGAADDANLVETARALMELVDAAGTAAGKYNVTIKDSQGVQVGDHNVQVNRFGD